MARQKKMQFYLTEQEYDLLKEYAATKQVSMGEILRDYIKELAKHLNASRDCA